MYEFIQIVTGEVEPIPEWESIYSEYSEMSGSAATNKSLELAIQITYISERIKIVTAIVQRLWTRRIDEAITLLSDMGFWFTFDDYEGDLERVTTMLRGEEIELNRAVAEYKEMAASETGNATSFEWYGILQALSKHNGYHINPHIVTVTEYCAMEKAFKLEVENSKRGNYAGE